MEFDYPCIITSPRASGDVIQMQLVPAINLHFFPFPGKAQSALLDAIIRYPFPWSRILTVEFLPLLASFFLHPWKCLQKAAAAAAVTAWRM